MMNLPDLYNHITLSFSVKREWVKSFESFPVFKAVYASGELSLNIPYLLDTLSYVYRVPKRTTVFNSTSY